MIMKSRKARYLAVMEHELAVAAFAEAMKSADMQYICEHSPYAALPLTSSMVSCAHRFIAACERLVKLNAKKA